MWAVVILLMVTSATLHAQTDTQMRKRNFFNWALGVGHNAADSSRWRSVNVGIFSAVDTLHGLQIGGISSITEQEMKGVSIAGLFTAGGGRLKGVQTSLGMNVFGGKMHGWQVAGISNVARYIDGVQLSGFANITESSFRGLQFSPFTNIAMGVKKGCTDRRIGQYCIGNNARFAVGNLQLR